MLVKRTYWLNAPLSPSQAEDMLAELDQGVDEVVYSWGGEVEDIDGHIFAELQDLPTCEGCEGEDERACWNCDGARCHN